MLRPGRRAAALVVPIAVIASLLAPAAPAAGQARDTARVPADTLRADTVAVDTIPPPPMVRIGAAPAAGIAPATWSWDAGQLLRSRHTSLTDLIADLPGVTTFRGGLYMQPELVGSFGATAGAVRLEVDGYVVDPLIAPSLDLSTFEVVALERVDITRGLDRLRIHLGTAEPRDARAYSRVEAATGEPNVNVFRGVFLAPGFLVGPLGLGIERLDTDGSGASEPADGFAGWLKWAWTRENRGVQLEYRQTSIQREPNSPWPLDYDRRDIVLRARNQFLPGLAGEVYIGSARAEVDGPLDEPVPPGPDEEPPATPVVGDRFRRSTMQVGVRTALIGDVGAADAALRFRDNDKLPGLELNLHGVTSPFGERAVLRGRLDHQRWDGATTTAWNLAATVDPLPFVTLFGELSDGSFGAPSFSLALPAPPPPPAEDEEDGEDDGVDDVLPAGNTPIVTNRTSFRVGAEGRLGGIALSGAFVSLEADSVAPFGMPFDTAFGMLPGGEVQGWEIAGRASLGVPWLTVDGTLLRWTGGARFVYMPSETWSTGLQLHLSPLESGNLEILSRFEVVRRGETFVPDTVSAEGELNFARIPTRTVYNADLVLRIMDVLAYIRYQDLSGVDPFDLPGRVVGGPRFIYGVKWHFWN